MTIELYWFRGEGKKNPQRCNFGDYLSPLIVEMLARRPVRFSPIEKADMIAIGTILARERKARRFFFPRRLHVWGSGTDSVGRTFSARHPYHAVRGCLTRDCIEDHPDKAGIALGDPGLLAAEWWEGRPRPGKKFTLGIVPHYVDQASEAVRHASNLPGIRIIDVFWPVEEVIEAIQECHFVISSSMHGLIIADAFGIPNRRIRLSDRILSDDKFKDYYSAFSLPEPEPLIPGVLETLRLADLEAVIGEYHRPGLDRLKAGLIAAFPAI